MDKNLTYFGFPVLNDLEVKVTIEQFETIALTLNKDYWLNENEDESLRTVLYKRWVKKYSLQNLKLGKLFYEENKSN